MRQLWHHYYAEATVVVFVVDSACPDPAGGSMSPADVGTEAPANVVQPQLRQQQEHTALGSRSPNDQQAACHAAEAALIASAADIESGAATICSAATAANRRADAEVHCGDNAAAAGSLDPAANEVMAAKHPALNAGAQDDRDMALTVEAQECREPVPDLQLSGEGLCHNDSPDEGEVEVQLPGKEEHIPLMCHTNTASQAPLHKRPHVPLADVFDGVISHPHMQVCVAALVRTACMCASTVTTCVTNSMYCQHWTLPSLCRNRQGAALPSLCRN